MRFAVSGKDRLNKPAGRGQIAFTIGAMSKVSLADVLELSVAERIQRVEDIWDSIAAQPQPLPLTQAQRDELDRRLEDHCQHPEDGSSWEEVKTKRWAEQTGRVVLTYRHMKTIPFSEAHAQLAATMDQVVADHVPVVITRPGSKACVLISLEDWGTMDETEYLMSSPANAQRLRESIQELENGGSGLVTIDVDDLPS